MNETRKAFGEGFYWGGSTSAFQFEGGASEGGKGRSVYDVDLPSGADFSIASDFYHNWEQDIDLLAGMGFNSFRMSIAWTRLFSNGDDPEVSEEGAAFYRRVFERLVARGIAPVVTLYHWDLPLALAKRGGWLDSQTVDAFLRYCETCFSLYGDLVKNWLTLNEDNLSLMIPGFQVAGPRAFGPDAPRLSRAEEFAIYHNTNLAHFGAVRLCHELIPDARIGCMLASSLAYPLTPDPRDVLAAQRHNRATMYDYLDLLTSGCYPVAQLDEMREAGFEPSTTLPDGTLLSDAGCRMDFISLSYYFSICQADGSRADAPSGHTVQTMFSSYDNPRLEKSSFGWTIDPLGLRILLGDLYGRYRLPLMVVENGLGVTDDVLGEDGCVHDPYRIEYLRQHISAVRDAVLEDKVDVLGYLPWGCIDLLSASGDASKRYGFVYVDFGSEGLPRHKKDSYEWYRRVIASNGADLGGE